MRSTTFEDVVFFIADYLDVVVCPVDDLAVLSVDVVTLYSKPSCHFFRKKKKKKPSCHCTIRGHLEMFVGLATGLLCWLSEDITS